jgi:trehalose synthase
MTTLEDYKPIVGPYAILRIKILASQLQGKKLKMVNSTRVGGGVAEMLERLTPLLNDIGIETHWDVIQGKDEFFQVTKSFHNALHGAPTKITNEMYEIYLEYTKANRRKLKFDEDYIVIHDPQPAALIEEKRPGSRWIWRCHIDVSHPQIDVWNFLVRWIKQYDGSIFSSPAFAKQLPIPQYLIHPSIDPLTDKNRELEKSEIDRVLEKYGIPQDKPIVTQISRYDKLKDPVGVVEAYKLAKREVDCRLLLVGNAATDDPEGLEVYNQVLEASEGDPDIHVLFLDPSIPIEINAFQRASTIIIQKSIREGFALTVTEGLWKGKPVIGGACGGIPIQIQHKINGILVHTIEGCAYYIRYLLNNPEFAAQLGERAHNTVKQNFLITRLLQDYLLLMIASAHQGESIIKLG